MAKTINTVLEQIEAQRRSDRGAIEGASALGFLQAIYRDRQVPLGVRMRAAIEALPFESPKLSATAVLTADDFATRLERAIARSGVAPKLIEVKALPAQPND